MNPFVLIIENNLIDRKLAGSILEDEGIDVRYASDAVSALTMLTKIRPALILIGLSLPRMNGVILTKILKQDPDTSDLKIIALVDPDSSKTFKESSAFFDGQIAVPFDKPILLKEIKKFLENKNTSQQRIITL